MRNKKIKYDDSSPALNETEYCGVNSVPTSFAPEFDNVTEQDG